MKHNFREYATRPEWTQQQLIAYGGPIAIGVVILQAFLTTPSLDLSATVSVLAVAISLPLLSAAVLITHAQASYQHALWPPYLTAVIVMGQSAAFVGVTAAFWHISSLAGIAIVAATAAALLAYRGYLKRVETLSKT